MAAEADAPSLALGQFPCRVGPTQSRTEARTCEPLLGRVPGCILGALWPGRVFAAPRAPAPRALNMSCRHYHARTSGRACRRLHSRRAIALVLRYLTSRTGLRRQPER